MKRVVVRSAGEVGLVDEPLPEPGPGEARVRTRVVGICGSDLHALAGEHPFIDLPYFPGHEVCGVVDSLGPGVSEPAVGARVLLEPNLTCGACEYCRSGRYNLCEKLVVVGCQSPGGMAEAFVVPAGRLHQVPEAMSDAAGALVEPMSTATHAVRVAGGTAAKSVAVLGAGPIGLLTLLAAKASGAARVAVTETSSAKRALALRLGADAAFSPSEDVVRQVREELGGHADVVFDCVSAQSTLPAAVRMAERGGTVVVVGVPAADVTVPLAIVQDREVRLEGSAMYTRTDVERAIELVGAPTFPVASLVTRTFPLEEAAKAFAAAAGGTEVKVQLAA
jgi:2-desacetyl-2-hydroxyethyl bacteriochlorophyllide A dehydrogenase